MLVSYLLLYYIAYFLGVWGEFIEQFAGIYRAKKMSVKHGFLPDFWVDPVCFD